MDANVLLECFSATLQSNQAVIVQAEAKLKELSTAPGFLGGCLDIISSTTTTLHPAVKTAAAVYFKNRIVRHWNHSDSKIDNDEKPLIRDKIIPVITACDYNIKQQLIPVLRVLISFDYSHWPGLIEQTYELLHKVPASCSDEDMSPLYTGVVCFSEICRKFRWMENDCRADELYPLIDRIFPHLLKIGETLVANSHDINELLAEILKLILKAYKFVTYYDLPQPLQSRESITAWADFHGSIINMMPPSYVMESESSEQEKSLFQVCKCYKWAIANIYRLFTRYASNNLSKKFSYQPFHDMFLKEFIPKFLSNFLTIIEQWCQKTRWIGSQCMFYMIEFISHCVTQKSTWLLIKPYFETLVSHFIYPLLCPTDDILETFDEDPHEYIHLRFDIQEEFDSPDMAALGLLATFAHKRKSTTLQPIMTFAHSQLTELQAQPDSLEVAKKTEGVLRILGAISHYIVTSYEKEMEPFLTSLIYPLLTTKYDFLKARALDITSKFADIQFTSEDTYNMLFQRILANFDASSSVPLPVSFQCALTIQAYMSDSKFRPVLGNIILPTMSRLLELSNEFDNDAISMVMQECVENFSEQLQPFGVDLMHKLVEQFMRLVREIHEASVVNIDDFDGNFDDQSEKVMAATGLLNTMITVLLSFENSQTICLKLEEVFYPAVEYVFVNNVDDFLAEIGELMENSTFLLRSISPLMWKLFEYLYSSFEDGTALMYLEELISCLENFLIFGQRDLHNDTINNINTNDFIMKFFKIFQLMMDSDDENDQIGYNDLIYGCEYGQTFILSLQAKSHQYIPQILTLIIKLRKTGLDPHHVVKNSIYDVNVNNVIVSALCYDAKTTLQVLQQHDQILGFFDDWYKLIPQFTRVYDFKLSIIGLATLISDVQITENLPSSITSNIMAKFMDVVNKLPKAMKDLETKRQKFQEFEFTQETDNYKFTSQQWENHEEEFDEDELQAQLENDGNEDSTTSFENDIIKASGYFMEEDEIIAEDPLRATPLDNMDVNMFIKQFLANMQNFGHFPQLVGQITANDQATLQNYLK
jgi:hypothetical protein